MSRTWRQYKQTITANMSQNVATFHMLQSHFRTPSYRVSRHLIGYYRINVDNVSLNTCYQWYLRLGWNGQLAMNTMFNSIPRQGS